MPSLIGSNAASVWWVNGQERIGIYGDRQTVIDDSVSKRLTRESGPRIERWLSARPMRAGMIEVQVVKPGTFGMPGESPTLTRRVVVSVRYRGLLC